MEKINLIWIIIFVIIGFTFSLASGQLLNNNENEGVLLTPLKNETIINNNFESGGWGALGDWLLNHLLLNLSLIFNLFFVLMAVFNIIKLPLMDITRYRVKMLGDDGTYISTLKINKTERTFIYKMRTFNFYPNHKSFTLETFLFWRSKTFYYNISNPEPIDLSLKSEIVFRSDTYNAVLESDLIKKINNWGANDWFKNLFTLKNMFIAIIVIVIVYWLANGGINGKT